MLHISCMLAGRFAKQHPRVVNTITTLNVQRASSDCWLHHLRSACTLSWAVLPVGCDVCAAPLSRVWHRELQCAQERTAPLCWQNRPGRTTCAAPAVVPRAAQ